MIEVRVLLKYLEELPLSENKLPLPAQIKEQDERQQALSSRDDRGVLQDFEEGREEVLLLVEDFVGLRAFVYDELVDQRE